MADGDPVATSARPRTTGPPTWPTRRGKLTGCKYGGANGRTAGLTQVRPTPLPADACPTARMAGMVEVCDSMVSHKGSQVARSQRPTQAGILQPDSCSTIPAADFSSRTPRYHPSDRAPTPHRDDRGRASAHRPEPAVLAQ
ncbi:hypothetical protein BHE74_00059213 [Ensete ventricosum]|nr:hypothetical protein BHE74_00059213 [Ensete ventricosum]